LGHLTQSKATLDQDIEVEPEHVEVQFLVLLRLELSSTKSSVAKMEQEKTRAFEKRNLERALMHMINTHSCIIIIITAAASQIALSTAHRHHHGRNMHHQHSSTEQQLASEGAPCLLVLPPWVTVLG
jgi:di/tricarboxylate transporter